MTIPNGKGPCLIEVFQKIFAIAQGQKFVGLQALSQVLLANPAQATFLDCFLPSYLDYKEPITDFCGLRVNLPTCFPVYHIRRTLLALLLTFKIKPTGKLWFEKTKKWTQVYIDLVENAPHIARQINRKNCQTSHPSNYPCRWPADLSKESEVDNWRIR